jgi:hypothetical protein
MHIYLHKLKKNLKKRVTPEQRRKKDNSTIYTTTTGKNINITEEKP